MTSYISLCKAYFLKMSDLLKQWLAKNKIENEKTLKVLKKKTPNSIPLNRASSTIPSDLEEDDKDQDQVSRSSGNSEDNPQPSTSSATSTNNPIPSTSKQAQAQDQLVTQNEARAQNATKPSDLIFENDSLKLLVTRGAHKQQTKSKFRLTDHMFYLSIVPKTKNKKMPLLVEILNFLYVAFNFILNQLKKFYNPRDRNIAFITIAQSSMINGLNSGISHF